MWTSWIGKKTFSGSVYISWWKVLGSLLGSGPRWPGTANIYISKRQVPKPGCLHANCQVFELPDCGQDIFGRVLVGPGQAVSVNGVMAQSVPRHANSSGTEFTHLYEGTNFHGPLVLKHAEATVSLTGLSHCFTAGGLSGEINPHFFTRRQWMRLDWEAVQPPCSEAFKTQLGEALSKLVWPHSCPHIEQEAGLRSLPTWIILCGTGSILCDSLSYHPRKMTACSGRGSISEVTAVLQHHP